MQESCRERQKEGYGRQPVQPEAGPRFGGTEKPVPRGWSKKEQRGGWGMLRDQHLPSSGCGDDGTCTGAVESPGGLSAGEDMSGLLLLRPDVLWLLWLRQGWSGGAGATGETGRNLLLKLPIPKYPDFCENCFLAVQRFPKRMYIGWDWEQDSPKWRGEGDMQELLTEVWAGWRGPPGLVASVTLTTPELEGQEGGTAFGLGL